MEGSKADDVLELERLLNNTLDKEASSAGNYLRGIGKEEIEFYKKLKINEEFTSSNNLSCTSDRDIAEVFYQKNLTKTGEAAIIDVYSKTGKKIAKYSDAHFEAEVLHKSKTKFRLKSMKFEEEVINLDDYIGGAAPIKEKRWQIIIEEI